MPGCTNHRGSFFKLSSGAEFGLSEAPGGGGGGTFCRFCTCCLRLTSCTVVRMTSALDMGDHCMHLLHHMPSSTLHLCSGAQRALVKVI